MGGWPNRHWIYVEPQPNRGGWLVETSYLSGFPEGERLPDGRRRIRIPGGGVNHVAVTKLFTAIGRAFLRANFEEG